jgi:hypothetical protein
MSFWKRDARASAKSAGEPRPPVPIAGLATAAAVVVSSIDAGSRPVAARRSRSSS